MMQTLLTFVVTIVLSRCLTKCPLRMCMSGPGAPIATGSTWSLKLVVKNMVCPVWQGLRVTKLDAARF